MSDNGPQFQREYNEFCEEWNIAHTPSSPRYAKSHGFIERQIRYIKPIIKKCIASSCDVYLALLNVRATPLDSTLPSPAGLMFGRQISTTLPNYQHLAVNDDIRDYFRKLSHQQKSHHDNVSKELAPLMTNQSVRIYYPDKNRWYIGKILSRERDRSYKVMSSNGAILIRNRIHLRPIVSSDYASHEDTPQSVDQHNTPQDHQGTSNPLDPKPHTQSSVQSTSNDSQYRTRYARTIRPPVRYTP